MQNQKNNEPIQLKRRVIANLARRAAAPKPNGGPDTITTSGTTCGIRR